VLGPATQVTLVRATLAVGVAALALADQTALVVTLAAVALALDAIDGWLARRTNTVTAFGARLDGEVDAFLVLVLSVYVAGTLGAWVLAIGAARYVFLAGELLLPWMRAPLPPRRWRKVVAATQGIVLTVAAADVVPRATMQVILGVALVLLAASMGQCAWWLWRRREPRDDAALTVLALLIVWAALIAPNHPRHLTLGTLAQLPLELLVLVALAAVLPALPRRVLAVGLGAVLGVLVLVKVLDLGMYTAFDRQFDPVYDWGYAGIGVETLRDAVGTSRAGVAVAVAVAVAAALLVLPVLSLVRVARVAAGHRARTLAAAAALGVVWVILRLVGAPVASTTEAAFAVREVRAVQAGLRDHDVLARAIARDRYAATAPGRMLRALRGKDVLLVFVESYGRVATQSPEVDAVLGRGTAALRSAGFSARSAFLTSPTFGGISWLAHATMQTGLWIDSRRRYDQLVQSDRLTLSQAFERAGWRAVGVMPQNKRTWKEGATFYHYDRVYDRRTLGYRGPEFDLPAMPDQYVLEAVHRLELERRAPLFAEVDLISSHAPWTRIPRLVAWRDLGDGSIFDRLPARTPSDDRTGYRQSIAYTLRALVSFVRRYGNDDLVVIAVGDHQPATVVTGPGAGHDVPVSVIARDPEVLRRLGGWGWDDGLRPASEAPVWRMSAFRDRFLSAFAR
jgi:phosphatidylglycerophosphate synthase